MQVNGVTLPNPTARGPVEALETHTTQSSNKARVDLEKLVLKPKSVPVEERMEQVISLEDIKRIFSLIVPYRPRQEKIDLGRSVDVRS